MHNRIPSYTFTITMKATTENTIIAIVAALLAEVFYILIYLNPALN